jgi:pimeloyl-ACP methyl ester carboxylesterase
MDAWPEQWVAAFCAIIEHHGGDVSLSRAHSIQCPVLILLGDVDRLNPVESGQRFISRLPAGLGTLQVFAGVGHFVHSERPIEFVSAITQFWRKHGISYGVE